jgi:phosphatidylinositol alpha-1,6-mannosyltransferase
MLMKNSTRILLITRKYPPAIGGMENYVYNIFSQMEMNTEAYKISLGRSQVNLIWFIPWSLFASIILCFRKKITHIHIGDALLSPLGIFLNAITGAKLSITVYGLDVIYPNPIYQLMIKVFLPKYRKIICISEATKMATIERGVSADSCHVVVCGVDGNETRRLASKDCARKQLYDLCGIDFLGKTVLLTVGRLVPRKGVAWFIEYVVPLLPPEMLYVVVGGGPESVRIESLLQKIELEGRVLSLGKVSQRIKDLIYDASDVFIMPNQPVTGDMEGFGIVALEAGMHNLPVVASAIEGITDAVIEGKTGILVECKNEIAFKEGICKAMHIPINTIPQIVLENFDWYSVYDKYAEIIEI